ncbi:hypothetical protein HDU76_002414, partial [Blyttiomyces sp. JEL0837]
GYNGVPNDPRPSLFANACNHGIKTLNRCEWDLFDGIGFRTLYGVEVMEGFRSEVARLAVVWDMESSSSNSGSGTHNDDDDEPVAVSTSVVVVCNNRKANLDRSDLSCVTVTNQSVSTSLVPLEPHPFKNHGRYDHVNHHNHNHHHLPSLPSMIQSRSLPPPPVHQQQIPIISVSTSDHTQSPLLTNKHLMYNSPLTPTTPTTNSIPTTYQNTQTNNNNMLKILNKNSTPPPTPILPTSSLVSLLPLSTTKPPISSPYYIPNTPTLTLSPSPSPSMTWSSSSSTATSSMLVNCTTASSMEMATANMMIVQKRGWGNDNAVMESWKIVDGGYGNVNGKRRKV